MSPISSAPALSHGSTGASAGRLARLAAVARGSAREHPLVGICLIVISTLFFSSGDALTKVLAATLPATEIAWIRYLTFTLLVLPFAFASGGGAAMKASRPVLQVLRGLCVVGSALLFTAGLRYLPVAEATATNFVSPIFITALSIPLLGEIVGWRRWSAAVAGLVGVLIVVRPGTAAFDPAALFPLGAALCWAGAAVITRKMGGERPVTTLAYSALVGLVFLSVLAPFDFVRPGAAEIGIGFTIGLLSTIGHWLVVLAFRHADASTLAPFTYVQLLWAGVLGFAVFGSVPDGWTFVGAAIIAASGIYTAHRERARRIGR